MNKLPYINSRIPHAVFPKAVVDRMVEGRVMTIRAGYGCGRKKLANDAKLAHRMIAPYISAVCCTTCVVPMWYEMVPLNFSIDLGPNYLNDIGVMKLMASMILSFSSMRNIDAARFTSLMSKPLFRQISDVMTRKLRRPEQYHELSLGLKEVGDFHAEKGNFETASIWYRWLTEHGPSVNYHTMCDLPGWEFGRPELYALLAVGLDTSLSAVALLVRQIELEMHEGVLHDDAQGRLRDCDNILNRAWDFGGASDEQRMLLHYYTGLKCYYTSLYFAQKGHSAIVQSVVKETVERWPNASLAEIRAVVAQVAAAEFFFAGELYQAHELSIKAREYYKELVPIILAQLGAAELTKLTKIVELDIQGHGTWRGSSAVAENWHLHPKAGAQILSKVGLKIKNEEELEEMRVKLGIPEVKPLGLLRFIVD